MRTIHYMVTKHIRYEINSEDGQRVLIIPNMLGIPDMKNVLCLADTSLEIWDMIANGFTNIQIINTICEKYQQEMTCVANDIALFINDLSEKNYIMAIEKGADND